MPYLIDGNNLLGSWGGPQGGDDRRAEVVRRVAAFCRARGGQATLVFDGGPLRVGMAQQSLGPLTIRVPKPGQDADSVIRELVEKAANPRDWIVVSSDKALYSYCKTLGASVLRAHEWNRLEQRVGPAVRKATGAASGSPEKPERETDIDGWLKKFGGND